MKNAYEEVKLAMRSDRKYLSEETMQYCLEALREHEEAKHNGFTNYPTWLVASWIDNVEEYYNKYNKLIDKICEENHDDFTVLGILAQTIEADFHQECETRMEDLNGTVWSSMLNHCSKDLINYREVAESLLF